ncbi:MAG: glycosyltransferase [Rubrivivax sp.]|nr:glycosyltransferase [Rubrivivax sp.]
MKLLLLAGDIDAPLAHIRLRTPLCALAARNGWTVRAKSFHACTGLDLMQADVVVVQRGFLPRALRLQQRARALGKAVVYEIDDLLTELPPHVTNRDSVLAHRHVLLRCLQVADALSVSTERLLRELAVDCPGLPPAVIVPNHAAPMPTPPAGPVAALEAASAPVALIVASTERLASTPLFAALGDLAPGTFRVIAVGPPAQQLRDAGIAAEAHALMPREQFIGLVRSLPNPLAVIPLEASRFAACKSPIKWFEYSQLGIPVVCSDVEPYRGVMQDRVTGRLVVNTAQAWRLALGELIGDAAARRALAAAAHDEVRRRHGVDRALAAWEQVVAAACAAARQRDDAARRRLQRLAAVVTAPLESVLVRVREHNRARLQRRRG